jgi:hypothetical protein
MGRIQRIPDRIVETRRIRHKVLRTDLGDTASASKERQQVSVQPVLVDMQQAVGTTLVDQ